MQPCDKDVAERFLRYWFPTLEMTGQQILIWTKAGKDDPSQFRLFSGVGEAAAYGADMGSRANVYFGVCSINDPPRGGGQRGSAINTGALWGLWLDVDVAHPEVHAKKRLPETYDAATELIEEMGIDPSIIVHSGHGLQAYWPLAEPMLFRAGDPNCERRRAAAGLAMAWNKTFAYRSRLRGLETDSVFDLARVMRLPGTFNRKTETVKPVALAVPAVPTSRLRRYDTEDFELRIIPVEMTQGATRVDALRPAATCEPVMPNLALTSEPEYIRGICEVSQRFANTWERKKTADTVGWADTSASSWDMSLTAQMVALGLTDQQIADALLWFRRKHGEDTAKLFRRGSALSLAYLMRTIGKARQDHEARAALDAVTGDAGGGEERGAASSGYAVAATARLQTEGGEAGGAVTAVTNDDVAPGVIEDDPEADHADEPEQPAAPSTGAPAPMSEAAKCETLALVSKGFGINIIRVTKQNKEKSIYSFTLADGSEVLVGAIQQLFNQDHVRGVLADATNLVIRIVQKPQWHNAVRVLLRCADYVENLDADRSTQITEYLQSYLACARPSDMQRGDTEEDMRRAFELKDPFIEDGRLYISATHLTSHIRGTTAERVELNQIWDMLRIAGFSSVHITKRLGGARRMSRWLWAANVSVASRYLAGNDGDNPPAKIIGIGDK